MDVRKIGKFIAECRKKKEMTQKELGDQLGVTDKSVSKWERAFIFLMLRFISLYVKY